MIRSVSAALALLPLSAAAEDLPRFDPLASCRLLVLSGKRENPGWEYRKCVEYEQVAYDSVKPIWSMLSENSQANCRRYSSEKQFSYQVLRECAERMLKIEAENERRKREEETISLPDLKFRY